MTLLLSIFTKWGYNLLIYENEMQEKECLVRGLTLKC